MEDWSFSMSSFNAGMFTEGDFLWPQPSLCRGVRSAYKLVRSATVEAELRRLFPSGFPVLFSSGRSALTCALIESGVTRKDLVGTFPFASHCVLNAIARVGTPAPGSLALNQSIRVVYHQWGFVQETTIPQNSIEDCVDTLCMPGEQLFPSGGRFEIWSLPKILGTTSGGVLWCRNADTAAKVRYLRDQRGGSSLRWVLRLLAKLYRPVYPYWQGAECEGGNVTRFQNGEILSAIKNWNSFVELRKRNLELIWPYAADWLTKPTTRLPCVIPVKHEVTKRKKRQYEIGNALRMFEYCDSNNERHMVEVLPVPIHQDITERWLIDFLDA